MTNIFDNYLDTVFGEHKQADFKIKHIMHKLNCTSF